MIGAAREQGGELLTGAAGAVDRDRLAAAPDVEAATPQDAHTSGAEREEDAVDDEQRTRVARPWREKVHHGQQSERAATTAERKSLQEQIVRGAHDPSIDPECAEQGRVDDGYRGEQVPGLVEAIERLSVTQRERQPQRRERHARIDTDRDRLFARAPGGREIVQQTTRRVGAMLLYRIGHDLSLKAGTIWAEAVREPGPTTKRAVISLTRLPQFGLLLSRLQLNFEVSSTVHSTCSLKDMVSARPAERRRYR